MKEPRYQQLLQTHVLTYHANLNKLDAVEIEACNEPFVTKWYFERHWPFQFDFGIAKGLSSIWLLFLHFGGDKISSHPHDARESTCQDVSLINRQVQRERKSIKVNFYLCNSGCGKQRLLFTKRITLHTLEQSLNDYESRSGMRLKGLW